MSVIAPLARRSSSRGSRRAAGPPRFGGTRRPAQTERAGAVRKERRVAFTEVEAPLVEDDKRGHQVGRRRRSRAARRVTSARSWSSGSPANAEYGELMLLRYPRVFRRCWRLPGARSGVPDGAKGRVRTRPSSAVIVVAIRPLLGPVLRGNHLDARTRVKRIPRFSHPLAGPFYPGRPRATSSRRACRRMPGPRVRRPRARLIYRVTAAPSTSSKKSSGTSSGAKAGDQRRNRRLTHSSRHAEVKKRKRRARTGTMP